MKVHGGVRKGKEDAEQVAKWRFLGFLKRQGKVYTVIVNDTKLKTLLSVIKIKIKPDSIVYTDSYHSYDVLDVSEFKHFRMNHSTHFAEAKNHINGIETIGVKRREY